mmetsp:Transcript_59668/g.168120  ORF Transcript_59668/g.168120 Transcript_59668/m.168120 type:complete len:236 (+) Transcript_59668:363-1070(+)
MATLPAPRPRRVPRGGPGGTSSFPCGHGPSWRSRGPRPATCASCPSSSGWCPRLPGSGSKTHRGGRAPCRASLVRRSCASWPRTVGSPTRASSGCTRTAATRSTSSPGSRAAPTSSETQWSRTARLTSSSRASGASQRSRMRLTPRRTTSGRPSRPGGRWRSSPAARGRWRSARPSRGRCRWSGTRASSGSRARRAPRGMRGAWLARWWCRALSSGCTTSSATCCRGWTGCSSSG